MLPTAWKSGKNEFANIVASMAVTAVVMFFCLLFLLHQHVLGTIPNGGIGLVSTTTATTTTVQPQFDMSSFDLSVALNATQTNGSVTAYASLFYNGSVGYPVNTYEGEGDFYTYSGYYDFCLGYPVSMLLGIRLYRGDYTANSISSAEPLGLYNLTFPKVLHPCLVRLPPEAAGTFEPKSHNVTVTYDMVGSTRSDSVQEVVSLNLAGYWSGSEKSYTFHPLERGNYTVEAVDVFNQTAIAHFRVD